MASLTALRELEAFLQRPPPKWNPPHAAAATNSLAIAHAALEHLRESGDESFLFLRTILELTSRQQQQQQPGHAPAKFTAHEEELFFHCLTGCRQVCLWQYKSRYSSLFLQTLRDFMMILGFEPAVEAPAGPAVICSRTLQMACFTASVALWKRAWNEQLERRHSESRPVPQSFNHQSEENRTPTPEEESLIQGMIHASRTCLGNSPWASVLLSNLQNPSDLLQCMETLIQSSQSPKAMECSCLYLQALVTEFVGKSAVSYRLPLEYHKQAHRSFEREGPLTKSLSLALNALGQVLTQLANGDPQQPQTTATALSVVQLTLDCLGWEFGMAAWDVGKLGAASTAVRSSLRPPVEWKTVLQPKPIVEALVHVILQLPQDNKLAQSLRQLLLLMASLSGPIFHGPQERHEYANVLLHGTLQLLQRVDTLNENSYLVDVLQLLGRLVANFRLATLVELSSALNPVLQSMASVGQKLLHDQTQDCERCKGDIDSMELREWREEALSILLMNCAVLLASDPWIMYSGTETSRRQAQKHLASLILGPLYMGLVGCRTRMTALEEYYLVSHGEELDEAREEITANDLEEELEGISTVGRLDLESALAYLAERHGQIMPRLQALWGEGGNQGVTAETAAQLEEARLLTLYVSYLLTDDNEGETPEIPMAVLQACQEELDLRQQQAGDQLPSSSVASSVSSAVQALIHFAEVQMHLIAANPSNSRLSPMLAQTFLQFLQRWAPAYIYPAFSSNEENPIVKEWSAPDKAQQAVTFCITLCLYYQCYWPQEKQVQEDVSKLLLKMIKRGGRLRRAVVKSPVFMEMIKYHCVTAGIRHGAPSSELEATARSKLGSSCNDSTIAMTQGYQRLSYDDRAQNFAVILLACSDSDPESSSHFNEALRAVHESFSSLVQALGASVRHNDVNAREMTCLCLTMLSGVTNASEMQNPERVPQFLTPFLPQLASLMTHYAADLTVCEKLLQLFQNYAAEFVIILDREQSIALFQASAELLKSYSKNHCENRVIHKSNTEVEAEEERAYSDILCAIQLLINLGAKDFIDACSTSNGDGGVDSTQVTDVIFFGLQQLLPLMTQGLLQFPILCTQFFELVSFMMESYADKVARLPYDLFNSLLQALLFGISHHDMTVAKSSLHGLASIAKEHLETHALQPILSQNAPNLLDQCLQRLFTEVIFRSVIMDRMESAGMALLSLAAANMPRLSAVLTHLCETTYQKDHRLMQALGELLTEERLSKAALSGYEGRRNRVLFKEAFEKFVNEVQAFLVFQ